MMFFSNEFLVTIYLLSMISARYALKWKGNHFISFQRSIHARRSLFAASNTHESEGHQTSTSELPSEEVQRYLQRLSEHQSNAIRLPMAEEVRTLLMQSIGYGVLSTNSQQFEGFPSGSVVGFHLDEEGKPFFVFSTMSSHTKDIVADPRCSLVVTSKDFKGAAEGRVSLLGTIKKVVDTKIVKKLRDLYLSKHKDAFWVDFGDFSFFLMDTIEAIRYVGGFARAGSISPEDYFAAKPDPIASFAEPVIKHMNEDHADSIKAMVQHFVGIPCLEAKMVALDRLGMTVLSKFPFTKEQSKIRLSFGRSVEGRKAIKEVLVEMSKVATSPQS